MDNFDDCFNWCKEQFIKHGYKFQSNSGYHSHLDGIHKTVFIHSSTYDKNNHKYKTYAIMHELGHLIDYLNKGFTYDYFHTKQLKEIKISAEKSAWDIAFVIAMRFNIFDDEMIEHAGMCLDSHIKSDRN